jgi:hypothetical protein
MRFGKLMALSAISLGAGAQAWANLVITPTYASNIAGDGNVVNIENAIQSAINVYEATFSDPITVNITFQEGGGLGGSSSFIGTVSYASYLAALTTHAHSTDDTTALAHLPTAGVGGQFDTFFDANGNISVKTANLRALGLGGAISSDGTITLNTSVTNPGSPGSSNANSLISVTEHEIDEVLGLGSSLPTNPNGNPFPEDLYRYTSTPNQRSWNTSTSTVAFFSIDGTNDLAQFHQQNGDGGDFGDWQTGAGPVRVQDWQATPGATPALGLELRALDVIGFTLAAPEPSTGPLLAAALAVLAGLSRRRA